MIGAVIFMLIVGVLIGALIVSLILMPTLRLMIKDRSGFSYVFNTVLPAMLVGGIVNLTIEYFMSSAQGVQFGKASGNWFNWPVTLAVLTYFINKRHSATVLQSLLAALITQVVLVVLFVGFAIVVAGALLASS